MILTFFLCVECITNQPKYVPAPISSINSRTNQNKLGRMVPQDLWTLHLSPKLSFLPSYNFLFLYLNNATLVLSPLTVRFLISPFYFLLTKILPVAENAVFYTVSKQYVIQDLLLVVARICASSHEKICNHRIRLNQIWEDTSRGHFIIKYKMPSFSFYILKGFSIHFFVL